MELWKHRALTMQEVAQRHIERGKRLQNEIERLREENENLQNKLKLVEKLSDA